MADERTPTAYFQYAGRQAPNSWRSVGRRMTRGAIGIQPGNRPASDGGNTIRGFPTTGYRVPAFKRGVTGA